jgi:O-antigen/teichoic acid export membrane protein
LGIIMGQGPFQLWEGGILDAYDKLKNNLAAALTQAVEGAIVDAGLAGLEQKRYTTRVITVDAAVGLLLNYLLIASQQLSLFSPAGLGSLILRLEMRFGSPLRKLLNVLRGEKLFSLSKTIVKTVAGAIVLVLKAGGGLAIILLSAKVVDDLTRNPRIILKLALRQDKPRRTITGSHRTRERAPGAKM